VWSHTENLPYKWKGENAMAEPSQRDTVFQIIINHFIKRGHAPHYTEIAAGLKVSTEEGKKALHDLFFEGFPAWFFPNTDYISSFPPFSNLPTQYRISVEGQQKWFGQWGFESLAVSWLFPRKVVQIDAPCLDCGSPVKVKMKDGKVEGTDPEGLVAYTSVPFREWFSNLPYSWSTMNLFRSKEHVQNWTGFKQKTEGGMLQLQDMVKLFSGNMFKRRLDPDYVTHFPEYLNEFVGAVGEIGKTNSFWAP
jgi:hypothetical protein